MSTTRIAQQGLRFVVTLAGMARPPGRGAASRRRALRVGASLALAGCLGISAAHAAEGPARILVGFPPGGSADTIARYLGEKLSTVLERPVIVENRPGAGGRIAVQALKGAPTDGSVVMLAPDAVSSVAPLVFKKLSYDPDKDYVPVSMVVTFPFALATGADPRLESFPEFVAWAKANPERATYGSPAAGSPLHFFGLLLGDAIGVEMVHVPFQGTVPIMTNLAGGQLPAGVSTAGDFVEQHRGKRIRVLAVSSAQRMPQLPEVPTFAELGYPKVTGSGFYALYAPAGTPDAALARWNEALREVLAMPDIQERLGNQGLAVQHSSPQEVARLSAEARAMWEPIIRESGFTAD